jgi:1-acyl-sn-glycerol-3-phosphate acyltransferase
MEPSGSGKRSLVDRLVGARPWTRRLVTIPAYCMAWLVATGLAPLWLPFGAIVGLLRRQSFVVLRLLLFLWVYLSLALVTLMGYLVSLAGDDTRRRRSVFRMSAWYGDSLFRWCMRLFALSVVVATDEPYLSGPLLVLVRHASIVDAALPAALLSKGRRLELRYILRKELMIEPCLDIAGHAGRHCFLDREGAAAGELEKVDAIARDLGEQAVVIYPEGTRFSEAKRVAAIEALGRTRPVLAPIAVRMTHVLPPKLTGVLRLLNAAPQADCLILAHRGLEGFAKPADFLDGEIVGRQLEIRMWRVRRESIPLADDQARWLFDEWRKVDGFVAARRPAGK